MKCVVPFIICENDLRQADHLKRGLQKLYPECTILQYQSGDQLLKESDLLKQECIPVSYTHLTLPTSDLV